MKKINLKFNKSETRLAGFPYGKTTYMEQLKNEINDNQETYTIVFPMQIEKVASSFVQGFFEELINTIGYHEIERRFIVETSSDRLTKKIVENIY